MPTPAPEASSPDQSAEPIRYVGRLQPDKAYYDGRIPHAVGVHHIQVYRANRGTGATGGTYNHQPYLIWWRDAFYLQFLSAAVHEHEAPTRTFLVSSRDGYAWSRPQIAFPEYRLPAFQLEGANYPAGKFAVMHQRMGFYLAPNGRLLTAGFYGLCPDHQHSPNAGHGVGRVVREVRANGTLGPIHFIRYNRHNGFDERNTEYPFYTASRDEGFRAACEALLADKLATLQWWEEDRAQDGFFPIDPSAVAGAAEFNARMVTSEGAGKAFTWFTRPDGAVVGLWKNQYSATSRDNGQTWTPIVRNRSLRTTGAKTWGQRTADGRYAIVYNHSATMVNRFPVSALLGDDGRNFGELVCLGSEVAPRRFRGQFKTAGQQYFRGISEGSDQPPDGCLWIAYSMNKEDIWILRAQVPVTSVAAAPVADDFDRCAALSDLTHWNFHLPQWASVALVTEPGTANSVLQFRDEDPGDYASAERVFPASRRVRIKFRLQGRELPRGSSYEIEVQSQQHHRPLRLRFMDDWLGCDCGPNVQPHWPFALHRWYSIQLDCDADAGSYSLTVDGLTTHREVPFGEACPTLERVVFRTGPWRGLVPAPLVEGRVERPPGLDTEDLPGADEKTRPVIFWIDDLTTDSI